MATVEPIFRTLSAIAATGASVATIIGVFYAIRSDSGRHSAPTDRLPSLASTNTGEGSGAPLGTASGRFTVENDVSHGVWAVASPTLRRMYPRERRPRGAERWISDGTIVRISCSKRAQPYAVKYNGKWMKWLWWGRLRDGTWVPLAPLREVLQDGSQGLPPCH